MLLSVTKYFERISPTRAIPIAPTPVTRNLRRTTSPYLAKTLGFSASAVNKIHSTRCPILIEWISPHVYLSTESPLPFDKEVLH